MNRGGGELAREMRKKKRDAQGERQQKKWARGRGRKGPNAL